MMRDLFGETGPPPKDSTPVEVALVRHDGKATARAWFLSRPGQAPRYAPRSLVTEGEGPNAGVFTMPRWVAAERGWL